MPDETLFLTMKHKLKVWCCLTYPGNHHVTPPTPNPPPLPWDPSKWRSVSVKKHLAHLHVRHQCGVSQQWQSQQVKEKAGKTMAWIVFALPINSTYVARHWCDSNRQKENSSNQSDVSKREFPVDWQTFWFEEITSYWSKCERNIKRPAMQHGKHWWKTP